MLQRTVPILASSDTVRTAAFYSDMLGFTVAQPLEGYLILERDDAEIHYVRSDTRAPAGIGCYIVCDDIEALHEEYGSRTRIDPPTRQPWGMTELIVVDPDGNTIKFAMASM